jgi:hypothetical protein
VRALPPREFARAVTLHRLPRVCFDVLKMNLRLVSTFAALLLAAPLFVHADDKARDARKESRKTNSAPMRGDSEKRRESFKNMSPEERVAKRKEIRARLEKRIGELRAKRSDATLSPQEARELERREQILRRFDQEEKVGIERPKPVFTNAPGKK